MYSDLIIPKQDILGRIKLYKKLLKETNDSKYQHKIDVLIEIIEYYD